MVDAGMNLGRRLKEPCLALIRGVFTQFVRGFTCLAFEPAPDVFRMALRSFREAHVPVAVHQEVPELIEDDGEVHAFCMALAASKGTRGFTHFPESPANSALTECLGPDLLGGHPKARPCAPVA